MSEPQFEAWEVVQYLCSLAFLISRSSILHGSFTLFELDKVHSMISKMSILLSST